MSAAGLDLAALAGRSVFEQCKALLDVLLGSPNTLQEVELRRAETDAILAILQSGGSVSPAEVVSILVASYIFNIASVELGERLRPSDDALAAEQQLREWISGAARQALSEIGPVTRDRITEALQVTLERTRRLLVRWRTGRRS